jgi:CheY-like chemotaxis protein
MTSTAAQILVVEDQAYWREDVFGESLQELGFAVFPAANKEQALELLDKHRFDLAIIDINLTDVTGNTDGLIVVDRIQSINDQIPIIVVSGTEGGLRALQERAYQVFAQMRKDTFDLEDFIRHVQKAAAQLQS